MIYIECLSQVGNAFAEWGSYGHLLLEKYFRGELEFFELSAEYIDGYEKSVKTRFPPNSRVNLNLKYYDAGKDYFDSFEGLFEDCKRLGIEQKIHIKISDYNFIGYIDLVLEDKNNNLIIVDHKSKSGFKSKREKAEYLRQLYLYSIYIYEKYGKYPNKMVFNMFRANQIIEEEFQLDKYEEAKIWAIDTIADIYNDAEFTCKDKSDYFCEHICSVNMHCPNSNKFLGG